MSKNQSISGFPEWLPEEKLVEEELISVVRKIYEAHGFVQIETPAVELIGTLTEKGVAEKELFTIKRLRAEADEESDLGLHFDLTVPFARYTAQHFNELVFPFRRYQLQKVWRGERPQRGRDREFYQFDIDIIARDVLPLACDAEVVTVVDKAFRAIGVGKYTIRVNNRKLLCGFLAEQGLDHKQVSGAVTIIDKLAKIGVDGVGAELRDTLSLSAVQVASIQKYATHKYSAELGLKIVDELRAMNIKNGEFIDGIQEISSLIGLLPEPALANLQLDLSLARGLDYYTGLIVEVVLDHHTEFGSVCGGGRYANLASQFINKDLPGVGVSIGVTRLMRLITSEKLKSFERKTKTQVLVAVFDETQRAECNKLAENLRELNVNTEVFIASPKLGKQIDYAAKLGIQFVAFLQAGAVEIKDIRSGAQSKVVDLASWVKTNC